MDKLLEVHKNELEKRQGIPDAHLTELQNTYCQVEWETPYYKAASDFWSSTIPKLLRLGKPEDVRIVFWFDN
jgi:hypothetical protein